MRTPVAINGTWDVKRVLGEVPVATDESACFEVPARTPVYFQGLTKDEIRTLALWIDLGVPYCGDYAEAKAWTPAERQWYEYNQQKRAQG